MAVKCNNAQDETKTPHISPCLSQIMQLSPPPDREPKRFTMKEELGEPHSKRTDDIDRYIGARIRLWRRTLDIDVTHLCKRLNITYQQLQKYEKGTNRISASRLFRIAQELCIPIEYFYQEKTVFSQEEGQARVGTLSKAVTTLEFMATQTALELCRNFCRIKNLYIRDAIFNMTKTLAEWNNSTE